VSDFNRPSEALGLVLQSARASISAQRETERRSSLENPQTPLSFPAEWLMDIFNGGRTDSGVRVSELTALQVSTCFACVNLIGSTIGALDLNVYEHIQAKDNRRGKRMAFEHDLFDLLHDEPNPEMTSFTFRKTLQAHALLWGNGYGEIQRDNGNRVVNVWPRNPNRCRPHRITQAMTINGERLERGSLVYRTTEGIEEQTPTFENHDGEVPERTILIEDMLHMPGLSLDGRLGQATVTVTRAVFGMALAMEKFGGKLFANGIRMSGIFSHPAALKDKARENLKQSLAEAYGGENVHRPMVLEEGLKFEPTSMKPEEAQFLGSRAYQRDEICAIFGVPPHMIGVTEKQNRANTEQVALEFLNFCLKPWIVCWQQEAKRKLFSKNGRSAGKFFVMFDTRPLTMPDAASRQGFYNAGKQWGWLCTNDIHEMEHLNPVDDPSADGYWMPINMQDMARAYAEPAQGPGPADGNQGGKQPDKNTEPDKVGKRFVRAYSRLFNDAFGRISTRADADPAAFRRAFLPVLGTIAEQLWIMAADTFGSDEEYNSQDSRFLTDYIEGIRNRSSQWKSPEDIVKYGGGSIGTIAERELNRAVRAIGIEIYSTVGIARAKKQLPAGEVEA